MAGSASSASAGDSEPRLLCDSEGECWRRCCCGGSVERVAERERGVGEREERDTYLLTLRRNCRGDCSARLNVDRACEERAAEERQRRTGRVSE